jgi:hypothetical protein
LYPHSMFCIWRPAAIHPDLGTRLDHVLDASKGELSWMAPQMFATLANSWLTIHDNHIVQDAKGSLVSSAATSRGAAMSQGADTV